MDITLFISFLFVSIALIIIPGPNVLVIVSTSITHGRLRGLQTVAGTSLAMGLQLVIAAFGTAWFIEFLSEGFLYLKWIGVCYLLYLAACHLKRAFLDQSAATEISASDTFARGFVVSLTNPKTILFFSAFLPQFVTSNGNYLQQVSILSVTFLLLAALLDFCYALLSGKLHSLFAHRNLSKIQNGFSGLLFISASAWFAAIRRTA